MPALRIADLEVSYGNVQALRGLTLDVGSGEIVAVLGNNGAGKTTTLAAVSGLVRPRRGTITWDGVDLTARAPWDIVGMGIVQVPEGRRVFGLLTVHENLQLGGYLVDDPRVVATRIERVYELIPRLAERRHQQGGTLSGGEQQMLALGRALVAGPRLLMLDEPSMGLAPLVVRAIMRLVQEVNESGTTVLLVEQNARAALRIAHRAYVLENGVATVAGPAAELARDPRVVAAYLGG
jgi:branched-chain amino acid transport system ATP-binding protein